MMPMYRCMDSYPEQRNQTFSFPQYPYPPYQPNPHMGCVPWPCGGYPNPMPCYSCCNHSNAPGYNGFRPSYPQTPMPSAMHFSGGFTAPYHEAYPMHYVPPPHYSMELPKYEYDKNMSGSHQCCGCPNHSHQNANKGVRIEEQESQDIVQKQANESLVPAQMKNYPYPILWIPEKEQRNITGPDHIGEQKKTSCDAKPAESLKSPGNQRQVMFPTDMNNIETLMQGGTGERVQDQRSEDIKREFPFPFFWMPSYKNKHVGAELKHKDMDASQEQQTEERKKQIPFPFFWFPYEKKEEIEEKKKQAVTSETRVNEDKYTGHPKGDEKEVNQKVIPVKHGNLPIKEDNLEDTNRGREVSVKHVEDSLANKPSGNSVQSQSSSPKKSSKLPPVCLRVDPLPSTKKKNAGGTPRSPSPPGHKNVQKDTSTDTTKACASSLPENLQQNQQPLQKIGKEVVPSKEEKVTEMVNKEISENKESMHASQVPINCKDASTEPTVGEAGKDGRKREFNEDQGTEKCGDATAQNVDEAKNTEQSAIPVADGSNFEKKRLSDVAAAVLIQSAYRGFLARRWEPLKKLKKIAEIREQVTDIRNQIASLETSDLKKDDKHRVVIGETIMRLLLRLDTIQGLLPSLRDMRRSLARELVLLQEKLDDIMSKQSQDAEDVSAVKSEEVLNANNNNIACLSDQQVEGVAKVGEKNSDGVNSHVVSQTCQGNVTHTMDSPSGVEVEEPEISEHKELHRAPENEQHDLPVDSDLESQNFDSGATVELKDGADGQHSAGEALVVDTVMTCGVSELEQCSEAASLVEDKMDHSVVSTPLKVAVGPELAQVAVNTEPAASEPGNDEALEMSKDESKQGGEVGLTMSPDITSPIAADDVTENKVEMHELLQLGTGDAGSGVVSELIPELKKNEEVNMVKEDDVSKCGYEEILAMQHEEGTVEKPIQVGGKVDEEHRRDIGLDSEVVQHHLNEASLDDPLTAVSQTVASQPLSSPVETSAQDMVHENGPSDVIDGGDACLSTMVDANTPNEDEIEKIRGDYEEDTELKANEAGAEAEESKIEQSEAETVRGVVLAEKNEPLPASPITNEVSSGDGSVVEIEGARTLIEENEKLRELMQKLMVAGNDQLQVISNLTGRVKDLEKKLAKKKKLRTRRSRAATSRSSSVKPASNH